MITTCKRPHHAKGYCTMHAGRLMRHGNPTKKIRKYVLGVEERLEAYIEKTETCWLWHGHMQNNGYGFLSINGKQHLVHRFMYEREVGKISDGLDIDHLCSTRNCVNPSHLEPVTRGENARRGKLRISACPKGHNYSGNNLIIDKNGWRYCRECRRINSKEQYRKRLVRQ